MVQNKTEDHSFRIKFPCQGYSIRVLTKTAKGFPKILEAIVLKHDPSFDVKSVTIISSRHGNYQSFRFYILATGEGQLNALHNDLLSTGIVKLVI